MRAGGPAGPELPLPWCPARRRRRHGAARGGAAPQRAGPARPRGARLQGNDVSVTSRERRHCPGAEGARGAERVPGPRRGRGAPGGAGGRCPGELGAPLGRAEPGTLPRSRCGRRGRCAARGPAGPPGSAGQGDRSGCSGPRCRPLTGGVGGLRNDTSVPADGKVLWARLHFKLSVGTSVCASADHLMAPLTSVLPVAPAASATVPCAAVSAGAPSLPAPQQSAVNQSATSNTNQSAINVPFPWGVLYLSPEIFLFPAVILFA